MTEHNKEIEDLALKLFYADCFRLYKFSNTPVSFEKEKDDYMYLAERVLKQIKNK